MDIIYSQINYIIGVMKKEYCKYCGLELENGMCTCDEFFSSLKEKRKVKETLICDTCKKKIDDDSKFCPYCGVVLGGDNNTNLQKELRGDNAPDVLEIYSKSDPNSSKKVYKRESRLRVLSIVMMVMAIILYSFLTFLLPFIKRTIDDINLKKELLNSTTYDYPSESILDTKTSSYESTYATEESVQEKINLKDKWVKQDGFYYAYDKNGDPVVDDWVTETDENGVEQKYYFDIDGKLVVNSWIDGEYYVGSDGAMLKDADTPDGAHVDEDGRVLLQQVDAIPVEIETHVYYESPNSESDLVVAKQQKSSNSGNIRGVDPDKTYELYIKNIIQKRETVTKGDLRCNIIYYVPVIVGAKEKEVKNATEAINTAFEEFKEVLIKEANSSRELPKSIIFNTVEQRTVNSNKMNIIVHGKVSPRSGLVSKRKFRFVYDRKSKKVAMADITE